MKLHELKFVNSDATPKTEIIHVATDSIERVMAWYGSYFACDRYAVFIDGEKVEKDQNGELSDSCASKMSVSEAQRECNKWFRHILKTVGQEE